MLSNYYIGYMVCIATAAYFFFYYCLCTSSERNPLGERAHFIKTLGRMAVFSALAVGMASIMILPAYYSLTFGKTTFSNPNFIFAQKFDQDYRQAVSYVCLSTILSVATLPLVMLVAERFLS